MSIQVTNAIQVINVRDIKKIFPSEYSSRVLFSKFIDYVVNYFFQTPLDEQVSNYIGKKTYPYDTGVHFIKEPTVERDLYQLDPVITVTDEIGDTKYACDYSNIINTLKNQGAITSNHNRLFSTDIWSWAPPINPDMFLNFNYYYWIPDGVEPFVLENSTDVVNNVIGKKHYTYTYMNEETEQLVSVDFTSGMRIKITDDANLEYNGNIYLIEGVGDSIYLIEDNDTVVDGVTIHKYSEKPDYICMSRGAIDGNPWSTTNRWFHKSAFSSLNVDTTKFIQARKPIICFLKDIQLYNYGRYARKDVDIIYNKSKTEFESLEATQYQGFALRNGLRVLITGDTNLLLNNRIYTIINYDVTNYPMLQLVADGQSIDGAPYKDEGFTVNTENDTYGGIYYYYNGTSYVEGQQKYDSYYGSNINVMPIFYVYDTHKNPLDDASVYADTTFNGCKLFSYKCDDTNTSLTIDSDIGHRILVASGENYLFENNFAEDKFYYNNANAVTEEIPGMRLYRINGETSDLDSYVSNWLTSGNSASVQGITSFIDLKEELQPVKQVYYYTSAGESLVVNDTTIIQSASDPSGRWVSIGNDDSGLIRVSSVDDANLTHGIDGTLLIIDELTRVYSYDSNAGGYDIDNVNYIATADGGNSRWVKSAGTLGSRIYEFDSLDEIQNKTNLIDNDLAIFAATSKYRIAKEYPLVTEPAQNVSYRNNFIYKNGKSLSEDIDYTIVGKTLAFTSLANLQKSDLIVVQVLNPNYNEELDNQHAYNLPLNLSSNAENREITEISYNSILEHLQSIIRNQSGFSGNVNGENNYSSTAQDISKGTEIIQNVAPLLKVPVLNTKEYTDIINVLAFVQNEYQKYKYRFNATMNKKAKNSAFNESSDVTLFVKSIIQDITIGKGEKDAFYNNGVGYSDMECFIPATPAWLGIAPLYKPYITTINDTKLIVGHDGSLTNAFDDYRDNAILEFENAIYNSVLPEISQKNPIFRMFKYIPGAFRETLYTQDEYNQLLRPDFEKWVLENNLIYTSNIGYSEDDPWTWNYSILTDYKGRYLPGNWKGIYKYYYDTISPNKTPWEMLGFGEKPYKLDDLGNKIDWWENRYGPAPYTANNYQLWHDIASGYIADGPCKGYHEEFVREDLLNFIPVDEQGNLLNPIQIGIFTEKPSPYYASRNWKYGDMADVEWLWTTQSAYTYSIQKAMYLMRPTEWLEYNWDTENITELFAGTEYKQIYYKSLDRRPTPSDIIMHNEKKNDKYVRKIGVQQWFSDNIWNEKCDITDYIANDLRNTTLKLGYKCASFYKADTIKLNSESNGFIPDANFQLGLYRSITPNVYTYSALRVVYVNGKYRVDGYDMSYPFFKYQIPVYSGAKHGITVGTTNITYYNIWSNETKEIPYGTEFAGVQDLFDFILGYGKYLDTCGWYYLNTATDGSLINWDSCARDCLTWINSPALENGSFILLNPGVVKIGLKHTGIVDNICSRVNSIWGAINISYEPFIQNKIHAYRQINKTVFEADVAIGLIKAKTYEYEHMIILDNYTIFGDILYDTLLNVRIRRLQLLGIRTQAWNGTLFAPGYVISDNGAIPNFENYANSFLSFYDTDSTSCSGDIADYVKATIGYTEKDYMKNLFVDDKSMFDFYKGMLREKGTTRAYNKVASSTYIMANMVDDELTTHENWMFHVGTLGNIGSKYALEFRVENTDIKQNPQQIIFTTANDINSIKLDKIICCENDLPPSDAIVYTKQDTNGWVLQNDNNINNAFVNTVPEFNMPTGGFARIGDTDHIIATREDFRFQMESFATYFNKDGHEDTVWIVNDIDNSWGIYKIVRCGYLVNAEINTDLNYTGSTKLTFRNETDDTIDLTHLKVGDEIVIDDSSLGLFAAQGLFAITDKEDGTGVFYCDNVLNYETDLNNIPVYTVISLKIASMSDIPALNKKYLVGNYIYLPEIYLGPTTQYAGYMERATKSGNNITLTVSMDKDVADKYTSFDILHTGDRIYLENGEESGIFNSDYADVVSCESNTVYDTTTWTLIITGLELLKSGSVSLNNMLIYKWNPGSDIIRSINQYDENENRILYFKDLTECDKEPNQDTLNKARWYVFKCIRIGEANYLTLYRYEELEKTNTKDIKTAYIVNDITDETLVSCQVYDPLKRIFPNVAKSVKYLLGTDPAAYNGRKDVIWGSSHLNELWWDISTVRYVDYEQGDVKYRREQWGEHLPGSKVDIYEWQRVVEKPDEVFTKGYNTFIEINNGVEITAYYGWVLNPDNIPENCDREYSANTISTILLNPTDSGVIWVAPIYSRKKDELPYYTTDIILANAGHTITDDKGILQINVDKNPEENLYKEWVMIQEESAQDIYEWLWTYLRYSLKGRDDMPIPNIIPSPTLPDRYKTGINYTKKQSMFGDMLAARKIFVEIQNRILAEQEINKADIDDETGIDYWTECFMAEEPYPEEITEEYMVDTLADLNAIYDDTLDEKVLLVKNDENRDGRWSTWRYHKNYSTTQPRWTFEQEQSYKVSNYWSYADMYKTSEFGLTKDTPITYVFNTQQAYLTGIKKYNLSYGDFAKYYDVNGDWVIVVYTKDAKGNPVFDVAGKQNGTLQLSSKLYAYMEDDTLSNNKKEFDDNEAGIVIDHLMKYWEQVQD